MKILKTILVITLFFIQCSFSQQTGIDWERWNWLMGDWIGEGGGQPGRGSGTFSFKFDLDKTVLIRKSHSEYPAKNNTVTVHEDIMIIYPDASGVPKKSIYFDNENHVINYTINYSDQSIIFISAGETKVPVFKLTYTPLDKNYINTKFEMSQDGEKFMTYIEGKSRRVE